MEGFITAVGFISPLEMSAGLTRMIEKNQAGTATNRELAGACRSSMSELTVMRQSFLAANHAQPALVQSLLKREHSFALEAFEDYRQVLKLCAAQALGIEKAEWDLPLINLKLANTRLSLAMLRFRDCILSERGPTTHPGVNHLLSLSGGVRERFDAVWEEEMIRARSALEELDQETTLGAELYGFNLSYLSMLEDIPMASDKLGPWLIQLKRIGHQYLALDLDYFSRRFYAGPTSHSWLNLILQSAWQVSRGVLSRCLVERILNIAREQLEAMLDRHRIYCWSLQAVASENSLAQRGEVVLVGLQEVVAAYTLWLDSEGAAPSQALVSEAEKLAGELDAITVELCRPRMNQETAAVVTRLLDELESEQALKVLLPEARAAVGRARQRGELIPGRLSKGDLHIVDHLQAEYRTALASLEEALETCEALLSAPSQASRDLARVQLEKAGTSVRASCLELAGYSQQA